MYFLIVNIILMVWFYSLIAKNQELESLVCALGMILCAGFYEVLKKLEKINAKIK